jgi:hypothetical protein
VTQITDSIAVLTSNPLPSVGEEIEVTGTVGDYSLGTMRMLVLKEKSISEE